METAIVRAIIAVGGPAKLAACLEVTPQVVINWRKRGVPAERCPAIERATHGLVRCEELRPDVDWAVLRAQV
jgi:DNA-binding transcriptional regulator YdaS (Cro superfamily)